MNIPVIEATFEYRIRKALRRLLADQEISPPQFDNGDDLFDHLWADSKDFGRVIIDDMAAWMSEDDWLEDRT